MIKSFYFRIPYTGYIINFSENKVYIEGELNIKKSILFTDKNFSNGFLIDNLLKFFYKIIFSALKIII